MSSWLPRFAVGSWEGYDAFDRDDAEGTSFSVLWLGRTIEIVVARRPGPRHFARSRLAVKAALVTAVGIVWLLAVAMFASGAWGTP